MACLHGYLVEEPKILEASMQVWDEHPCQLLHPALVRMTVREALTVQQQVPQIIINCNVNLLAKLIAGVVFGGIHAGGLRQLCSPEHPSDNQATVLLTVRNILHRRRAWAAQAKVVHNPEHQLRLATCSQHQLHELETDQRLPVGTCNIRILRKSSCSFAESTAQDGATLHMWSWELSDVGSAHACSTLPTLLVAAATMPLLLSSNHNGSLITRHCLVTWV